MRPLLKHLDLPPLSGALIWAIIALWAQIVNVVPIPEAARPVGTAIIALGLGFGGWALLQYWGKKTPVEPHRIPHAFVTTGPYRLTRNPMYRGLLLCTIGFVVLRGELTGLVFTVAYGWILNRRFIIPEERMLEAAFGDAFHDWTEKVRWRL
jgi:protein-S-isoprenylcysteine O-methyltransferase Ste14